MNSEVGQNSYIAATSSTPLRTARTGFITGRGPAGKVDDPSCGSDPDAKADICVIADDRDERNLLRTVIARAGYSVSCIEDPSSALDALRRARPKAVLCDFDLPGADGIEICKELRKDPNLGGICFLLMSAAGSKDLAARALDSGADDFLSKPLVHGEWVARIRVGLRVQALHDQLKHAAMTDGLTGLLNHEHFHRGLSAEINRARRYGHPVALVLLDVDFFKAINDTFGHPVGNTTLRRLADLLRESVRNVDSVGRIGGEEFAILLPESTAADGVGAAERIRTAIRESLRVPGLRDFAITTSFGVAEFDDRHVSSAESLVDWADRALYLAKRRGRDQVARASELDDAVDWSAEIQTSEVDALRRRLASLSARAKDVYVQSVAALLQVLNEKDPYTARHAMNVAFYAHQMAEEMRCTAATRRSLYNAALLHDIGKVGVPDQILMKRTPLTPVDRRILVQVPLIGARIVDHLRILEGEVQIIRHQHEHVDGSGYPDGLSGRQIPIGARILHVANAFDAITTDRIYRQRRPMNEAMSEIQAGAGTQFDPDVVQALLQLLRRNRSLWQQRIDDTIAALRVPCDLQLPLARHSLDAKS